MREKNSIESELLAKIADLASSEVKASDDLGDARLAEIENWRLDETERVLGSLEVYEAVESQRATEAGDKPQSLPDNYLAFLASEIEMDARARTQRVEVPLTEVEVLEAVFGVFSIFANLRKHVGKDPMCWRDVSTTTKMVISLLDNKQENEYSAQLDALLRSLSGILR